MRLLCLSVMLLLSGCESMFQPFPQPPEQTAEPVTEVEQPEQYCLLARAEENMQHNCALEYWLEYWVAADSIEWPQRKQMLSELDDSTENQLRKILLCQSRSTPYQDRLRAQRQARELFSRFEPQMRSLFNVILFQPSQQLLEFESAMTVLSRVNSRQSKSLQEQKQQLQQQQQQLNQLMKLEASMVDKETVKQQEQRLE